MCKTNKRRGWFYYIGNSKPWLTIPPFDVYCNKRRMGGKSSITLKVDSTSVKETRVVRILIFSQATIDSLFHNSFPLNAVLET